MRPEYQTRLTDWIKWYNYHHGTLKNSGLEQKIAFLDKCVEGLFTLVVATAEEADKNHAGRNTPKIVLPTGLKFNAPIRRDE